MQLTRDVVNDLLTVYLAGEASTETRALVEEYLRTDPELARQVEVARAGRPGLPATAAPSPGAGREALEATRRWIRRRTASLAAAVFTTLVPLTFVFEGSRVTFFLIRDAPAVGVAWWSAAAILWVWHLAVRRRLRVSGL